MKTAIVTGAGRGIGAAIAARLAQDGFTTFAWDLAHEASALDGVEAQTVDVADPDAVSAAVETVRDRTGQIDVLVNNAGIRVIGDVVSTSVEDWDRLMSVNLRAVFVASKFVVPVMLSRSRGAIVNIASMAATNPMWDRAAYCASKAGVLGLTKQMALQYARLGVRVNAVCPGPTLTPFMRYQLDNQPDAAAALENYQNRQPIGRLADPEHVAAAVAYLASDAAEVVTGAEIAVDCGTSLLNGQGASGRLAS